MRNCCRQEVQEASALPSAARSSYYAAKGRKRCKREGGESQSGGSGLSKHRAESAQHCTGIFTPPLPAAGFGNKWQELQTFRRAEALGLQVGMLVGLIRLDRVLSKRTPTAKA